ncbi:MAG: DUF1631 domain-containing protein [Acidovorax sp.]
MSVPPSRLPQRQLAHLARQRFVAGLGGSLAGLDDALFDFLGTLASQTGTAREMQSRRDALLAYQQHRRGWTQALARAWTEALAPRASTGRGALAGTPSTNLGLALVSDDEVDNKIAASRMALAMMESVGAPFDLLRQRTQQLEAAELPSHDILRPETCCLLLVEQWVAAGLPRADLNLVIDPLQRTLAAQLLAQYEAANRFYDEQGVPRETDLRARVRRSTSAASPGAAPEGGAASRLPASAQAPLPAHSALPPVPPGAGLLSPLAHMRQRAQGVVAHLRRLLVQPGNGGSGGQGGYDMVHPQPPSPALAQALSAYRASAYPVPADTDFSSPATVVQLVGVVRERAAAFKQKASTASEKAIIEVVALMFQSILAEDRIPPRLRVWFARLQVPVLRVALAEPAFFNDLAHPARKLIDRMGACVMGFEAADISGSALEAEVRRVVQVIEQYPETGQRVFQLVLEEFEKFLAQFLTEGDVATRLVDVAQQVEQRETLTIQYTIELRTLLSDMPVRDAIRVFLFKTWAEVLALSAVRHGAQHADTLAFKRTATDLVWAASAKPQRAERAQVIQSLPGLLQRLRAGLALLGIEGAEQDAQIKQLTDTLADAFLSKTEGIPQAQIDAMARRLAHLEDFVEDTSADLPLSRENIELMLGIDASSIHVMADTDAPVQEAMLQWAQALPVGAWYALEHNGASASVQYAWCSARKQLHLFAAMDGSCYLIQLRRLGAYLQAGLLTPQDEEGLTMRATRDALAKLDANPERLLN